MSNIRTNILVAILFLIGFGSILQSNSHLAASDIHPELCDIIDNPALIKSSGTNLRGNPSSQHKIIYLISPPRSLSVSFMRMAYEYGFEIFVEPSQCAFNNHIFHKTGTYWFLPSHFPQSEPNFSGVKQNILAAAKHSNVFVKEMCYAVRDFLLADTELLSNPNVYFFFLVRNPHHSMLSFYKKVQGLFPGTDAHTIEYQSCWELFSELQTRTANTPRIIFSEDLYSNPVDTIRLFCKYSGIPYKPEVLSWKPLGPDFDAARQWHDGRIPEVITQWYTEALSSTGFGQPSVYEVDGGGDPTFNEITNKEHRAHYQKSYTKNMTFYEKFLSATQYHLKTNLQERVT